MNKNSVVFNFISRSLTHFTYYLLVAVSLFLFLFIVRNALSSERWTKLLRPGWDANVYCRAGSVIRHGGNPYLENEMGTSLSWNYLPVFAYGFYVFCSRFDFKSIYLLFCVVAFLLSMDLWLDAKSWLYGLILCGTGLFSLGWGLLSGNIAVLEFTLILIAVSLFLKKKYRLSFLILGLSASIKIIPLLYLLFLLYFLKDWKSRRETIVFGGMGFIAPFLASLVITPWLMPWYLRQLVGGISGQHAPITESFGFYGPSFPAFLVKLFGIELSPSLEQPLILTLSALMLAGVFFLWKNVHKYLPESERSDFTLAFGMIALTLFIPRLKPYSFLPALMFVYFLTQNASISVKNLVLLLLSVLPQISFVLSATEYSKQLVSSWPVGFQRIFLTTQEYYQAVFLFLMLMGLILLARYKKLALESLDPLTQGPA
jgi:hypothetical protein